MDGNDFVKTLKELKYPSADKLEGGNYDWMFDCAPAKGFLNWFCRNLDGKNILDPAQTQLFEELRRAGGVVLEGPALEKALLDQGSLPGHPLSLSEDEEEKEDDGRMEEMSPKKMKEYLEKRIERLQTRIDSGVEENKLLLVEQKVVSGLLLKSERKHKQLESSLKSCNARKEKAMLKSRREFEHLTESVKEVKEGIRQLLQWFDYDDVISNCVKKRHLFMSQCDLQGYIDLDEEFTKVLQKEHEELMEGWVVGRGEKSGGGDCVSSGSDSGGVGGGVGRGVVGEMGGGVRDEVAALEVELGVLEKALFKSECEFIEESIEGRAEGEENKENKHGNKQEIEKIIKKIKHEIDSATILEGHQKHQIEFLLRENARMGVEGMATENYSELLGAQKEIHSRHYRLLTHITTRNTLRAIVGGLVGEEGRRVRRLRVLLEATSRHLKSINHLFNGRKEKIDQINTRFSSLNDNNVLTNNQSYFQRVNDVTMMSSSSRTGRDNKGKLFTSHEDLLQRLSCMQQSRQARAVESLVRQFHLRNDCNRLSRQLTKTVNKHFQPILSELSKWSYVVGGDIDPDLDYKFLPQPIIKLLGELCELLRRMEAGMAPLMKEMENKMSALKHDDLLAKERRLPLLFYGDVAKLRRVVQEIKED